MTLMTPIPPDILPSGGERVACQMIYLRNLTNCSQFLFSSSYYEGIMSLRSSFYVPFRKNVCLGRESVEKTMEASLAASILGLGIGELLHDAVNNSLGRDARHATEVVEAARLVAINRTGPAG